MHWFWRGMITVGVGGLFSWLYMGIFRDVRHSSIFDVFHRWLDGLVIQAIFVSVPIMVFSIVTYELLTRYFHPKRIYFDGETRCRKCGYILRGITEPRCPECGEKI
ncbi:MAG: hypothetical protein ACYTF1_18360 [Planctomycetota bacterium]|jgi:hypothetical protein